MEKKNEIQIVDFESLPIDYSDTGVTEAVLAKLKEDYTVVPDCSTKEGYAITKAGITLLRTLRIKIETKRKKNNEKAVDYKKRNDSEAANLTSLIVALEEPMKVARKAEDEAKAEEKRLAAIKEQERVAAIEKDINTIRNVVLDCHGKDSGDLTEIIESLEKTEIAVERFAEHTPIAEAAKIEAIQRLVEMRDQALDTEKADYDREIETGRLADERKKLDEERIETERKTAIKNKIQAIKDRGAYDPEATAEKILGRIHVLENTRASKEVFEEFTEEAHMAVGLALSALKDFHTVAVEKERLAAVAAAEEAVKAQEEAAELEGANTESPGEEPIKEEPPLPDDDVVDAEFVEEELINSDENIKKTEVGNALLDIDPSLSVHTVGLIYDAIKAGEIPHVQLIGGESC